MDQQRVFARPNIYIDVIIDGQKQIYDVETATILKEQLDMALKSLNPTVEDNLTENVKGLETARLNL